MIRKTLLVTAILTTIACSSSPSVPDQEQPRDYASTGEPEKTESTTAPVTTVENTAEPGIPKAVGPVAKVNGTEITAEEYNKEISRLRAANMPPGMMGQMREQLLDKMIEQKLLELDIAAKKIDVADSDVDSKLEEVKKQFASLAEQTGEQNSLETLSKQLGITPDELRKSIEQSIAIEKLLTKEGLAFPTDKEIKAFYDENQQAFQQEASVRARHILVKVEAGSAETDWELAKKKADAIYNSTRKKGADFAAIAKEKSEGPSAPNGGDLGFFGRGRMVPEFESAVFDKKPGAIVKPVRTQFGWHVIKVEEKRDAGLMPFKDVSGQIKQKMTAQRQQTALVGYLEKLKGTAKIEKMLDNIK